MGPATFPRAVDNDEDVIDQFLRIKGWAKAKASPVPGDFSARLYRRLRREAAAPEGSLLMRMGKPEELQPFMVMRDLLHAASIRVPAIYAADEQRGLALVEDLGDARFDKLLAEKGAPEKLYPLAVDVLVNLHKAAGSPNAAVLNVPQFNAARFSEQAALVLDVYGKILPENFSESARASFMETLIPVLQAATAVPDSLMLRDYHAANILYLPHETGHRRAGVIDFQDGGVGPITYDLASLLEDARRDVSPELRREMIAYYLRQCPSAEEGIFRAAYPAMAAQRHVRVIAVTARRWADQQDEEARSYMLRSWNMLYAHAGDERVAALLRWLDLNIPEKHRI